MEFERMGVSKEESTTIADGLGTPADTETPRPKKKGPKAPNPLSVMKKKAKPDERRPKVRMEEGSEPASVGAKRKRAEETEEASGTSPGEELKRHRHRKRRRRVQGDAEGEKLSDS